MDVRLQRRSPSWSGTDQRSCYRNRGQAAPSASRRRSDSPKTIVGCKKTHSGPSEDIIRCILVIRSTVREVVVKKRVRAAWWEKDLRTGGLYRPPGGQRL